MLLVRRWSSVSYGSYGFYPSVRSYLSKKVAVYCSASCGGGHNALFNHSINNFTTAASVPKQITPHLAPGAHEKVHRLCLGGRSESLGYFIRVCGFASSSGNKNNYITREWLKQLWVEDIKEWKAKRTKEVRTRNTNYDWQSDSGNTHYDWQSDSAAFVSHVQYPQHEVQVRRSIKQPPVTQIDEEYLIPKTPEEVTLQPLLSRSNLVIARDIEWASIMFAFEQESRYVIIDPSFPHNPTGYIREKSNVLFRQLLRSRRPFVAHITDASGNEVFTVRRPFWWINSVIYVEVNGQEIGLVRKRWHLWRRIYDLYLENRQFAVVENPGFWKWTFTLQDSESKVIAQIDRAWRGMGLELFTDAGQYIIRFGDRGSMLPASLATTIDELDVEHPLTLSERAVALALAISLDCDFFSRRGGWLIPFLVMTE